MPLGGASSFSSPPFLGRSREKGCRLNNCVHLVERERRFPKKGRSFALFLVFLEHNSSFFAFFFQRRESFTLDSYLIDLMKIYCVSSPALFISLMQRGYGKWCFPLASSFSSPFFGGRGGGRRRLFAQFGADRCQRSTNLDQPISLSLLFIILFVRDILCCQPRTYLRSTNMQERKKKESFQDLFFHDFHEKIMSFSSSRPHPPHDTETRKTFLL